jgi:predicted RNase H-like nuclease (RuvC/YqgF family)
MGTHVITADRQPAVEKEKRILSLELAEIQEISELMFKKLEMKIQVIQALEASVDKKKAELNLLIQRAEALKKNVQVDEGLETSLDKKKTDLELLVRRAETLEKNLQAKEEIADSLDKRISALQRLSLQSVALKPEGGSSRHQEIVALSRKSLSSREIAEVLDMPLGEVELILELSPHQA